MVLRDFTDRYNLFESWTYDQCIAPAVAGYWNTLSQEIDAALPPNGTLLDVGCGGGQNAIQIARLRGDVRVTGIDLSPDQVRRARKRARGSGGAISFASGSALDLPFPASSFDCVLSVASIKHWPDQTRGISECVRVLKESGKLLIIEADRGCRLKDVQSFVDRWRIPKLVKPMAVPLFRTYVAGQALDLEDARLLLQNQPLRQQEVRRLEGIPALILRGTK